MLCPPVGVTPGVLARLEGLAARAEALNLNLAEQV